MQATFQENHVNKFRDAEQLWFWFISGTQFRSTLRHAGRMRETSFRPCESLDIETLITRLFLSGRISREQLEILKQYGERRRAPSQHIWSENRAAMLWTEAMRILQLAFGAKGWIE